MHRQCLLGGMGVGEMQKVEGCRLYDPLSEGRQAAHSVLKASTQMCFEERLPQASVS